MATIRLYHGTSAEAAASIRQNGLTTREYREMHETLTESREQALRHAQNKHGAAEVIAFDVPVELLFPAYERWSGSVVANTYAIRQPIPTTYIATDIGTVQCHECGKTHQAEFSHISDHGGHRVFAVVCDDDLTDYYTEEAVTF
jgi:hypothetical protein